MYDKSYNSYVTLVFFCISNLVESQINVATTLPPKVANILKNTDLSQAQEALNETRRILKGYEVINDMPFMVYLKLPSNNPKYKDYRRWLCGGVIIHDEYILTSAACIEDAKHFYIVSGTNVHNENDDRYNNACIKNGAKRAIWKCVPRNYVFDGHENDNIRWMNNDIAVVKVEEEFDFTRRIRGCDFVPKPICYNNYSSQLENPGNLATIAGWGSQDKYSDWVNGRRQGNSGNQNLLAVKVEVISKTRCKLRWGSRYYNIIENYMICSRDSAQEMSEICQEKYVDCKEINTYDDDGDVRRRFWDPEKLILHSAYHNDTRRASYGSGGFCENDHGGPMVYGDGVNSVVIGIISACLVKERTNQCYGPFLYTSVYKNRVLINCAVYKTTGEECSKMFRAGHTFEETHINWEDHPDGPAKNEIKEKAKKLQEKARRNKDIDTIPLLSNATAANTTESTTTENLTTSLPDPTVTDHIKEHEGIVVRNMVKKVNATSTSKKDN